MTSITTLKECETVLNELDVERQKFTYADKDRMQHLVGILNVAGIYPTTPVMRKYGYTALTMVENYGARWHIWREPLSCKYCKSDFRDHESGPPYKREKGVYDLDKDTTVYFVCPDCEQILK